MGRRSTFAALAVLAATVLTPGLTAQEIDNGTIRAVLGEDATVGLTLVELGRSGETFAFRTLSPTPGDAGLWRLVLTPRTGGPQEVLGPEAAGGHTVEWDADGLGATCTWEGVTDSGGTDAFTVSLSVRAEPGEPWLRWTIGVTREAGSDASIDIVRFPILHWAAPIEPQGSETLAEAQRRARVLVPNNGKSILTAGPLDMMGAVGLSHDLRHPGPGPDGGQYLGIAFLADMDPLADGYRHVLVQGALDFSGFFKVFHHAWHVPSATDPAATWWHDAYPAFDGNDPDGFDNDYLSPYPAITGVVVAHTNAFWWAGLAPYRDAFEASAQAVPPAPANGGLGVGRRPFWITGHIQLGTASSGEPLYRGFQRQADRVRAIFEPVGIANALPLSHWQTYLDGGQGVATPDTPVSGTIDAGVPDVVGDMEAEGYTVSVYLYASGVSKTSNWYTQHFSVDVPQAELRNRDGSVFSADEMRFDLGHATIGQYYTDHVVHDVMTWVGSSGIYLDTLIGAGAILAYHSPDHPGHGGDSWMEGKRRFLAALRDETVERAADNGKQPDASFVISEAVDEGAAGRLDLVQDGYVWPPSLMRFYECSLLGAAPDLSLDWAPPLWSAVYHEWQPVTQLGMPFSSAALDTSPYQTGYDGLSTDQMIDLWAFVNALYANAGYRIELNDFTEYETAPLVDVDADGNLVVDPAVDPGGSGLEIAAFLRRLWSAYDDRGCGPFLLHGRMMEPLDEDFSDPEVSTVTNPIAALSGSNPAHFAATYPSNVMPSIDSSTGNVIQDIGATAMPVPTVLISVWEHHGDTAIVAINWTGANRTHRGVLHPGGLFSAGSQFYLETPSLEWIGPLDAGSPLTLHWSPGTTAPPDIHLGTIPARTVQLLRLRLALPGDDNADRTVTAADLPGLVAEIFDLDGTAAADTAGGTHLGSPNDDADSDGTVASPDLVVVIAVHHGMPLPPGDNTDPPTHG